MALSKEALAEQRRVNGRKSLGPISAAGKRASSMNALAHGMRAEKLFLPSESPEMFQEHVQNWTNWYQPESPASMHLMEQCIYATLVSRRTWLALMSATTSQVEDADLAWNQSRNAIVAGQSAALPTQPAAALAALKMSGHGCRFVLQSLRDLGDMLARDGSWPLELAGAVVNLFGAESGIDQLGRNETAYRIFLSNLHCRPQTPETADLITKLSATELRPQALKCVDLRSWLPGRAVCREWLRGLVAAEIESVSLLEQALRTGKDASDHERLMDGANLLPEGELSRQVLRYSKDADSKFLKNYKAFKAELKQDRAPRYEDDDSDDSGGEGAGPPVSAETGPAPAVVPEAEAATIVAVVTAATTPAPGPGKTGRVDSPNDPDDGGIVTAGAPNRVGNGVLLVLLGMLIGQLFLGLGRGSAEGNSPRTPERPRAEGPAVASWLRAEAPTIEEGQQTGENLVSAAAGPASAWACPVGPRGCEHVRETVGRAVGGRTMSHPTALCGPSDPAMAALPAGGFVLRPVLRE